MTILIVYGIIVLNYVRKVINNMSVRVRVSKDLDELLCVIINDLIRVMFIATLVVIALSHFLLAILFFNFVFKLSDLVSYYVIKLMHLIIGSGGDDD